jgi:hypothetical protein
MINNLQHAIVLDSLSIEVEADDPDDAFLLSMSVEGAADYLVTGDRRSGLIKRGKIERTRILTPARFYSEILKTGGRLRGVLKISENFDEPLPDDLLKQFYQDEE